MVLQNIVYRKVTGVIERLNRLRFISFSIEVVISAAEVICRARPNSTKTFAMRQVQAKCTSPVKTRVMRFAASLTNEESLRWASKA
jgi:hypothetical protein